MVRVAHCCCCFDLKYGYYTFGIIALVCRFALATVFYFAPTMFLVNMQVAHSEHSAVFLVAYLQVGYLMGWFLASAGIVFVSLKGIVQERAMLIYPSIVIFILELVVSFIATVITAITATAWALLYFVFTAAIDIYALICLISLFHNIKDGEKQRNKAYDASAPLHII